MAYGGYSEVYLAFPMTYPINAIKIGETTNARRRACQLRRSVGFDICGYTFDVKGWDKTSRLIVEDYIRGKIFQYLDENSIHYIWRGLDYFFKLPTFAVDYISNHFEEWVKEANSTLD